MSDSVGCGDANARNRYARRGLQDTARERESRRKLRIQSLREDEGRKETYQTHGDGQEHPNVANQSCCGASRKRTKRAGHSSFPAKRTLRGHFPGIQSAHARALRESKVAAFRPYDCRPTWATRAVEAGVDLVTLAAMLGHSKINMVLRYAHPTQEHQARAMDKMELYVSEQKIAHSERTAPQTSYSIQ